MRSRAYLIAVFALFPATLACAATDLFATATPTLTPTPTSTPTPIPTPTPELTAADVRLNLGDLPDGYVDTTLFDMDSLASSIEGPGISVESTFGYQNGDLIVPVYFGFTVGFSAEDAQTGIDEFLSDPQALLESFTGAMGNTTGDSELPAMDDIGDASAGITTVVLSGDFRFRVDGAVFRRNSLVVFVFSMYTDGDQPPLSIRDVAELLDARAQAVGQ